MGNNFVDPIPGYPNPIIGTVAISDVSGTPLTVTGIYRYDGGGVFECSVTDGVNFNGTMNVYWDTKNNRFAAKIHSQTHYADEDGVKKGL